MSVRWHKDGPVALVTIDNPPVNALSIAVRRGLWDAAHALDADGDVAIVILTGGERIFVGGADITEFDGPVQSPTLPELFEVVEGSRVPWMAVIGGAALGGGLELALACHYRVATPQASFALPEINLGIIPGAGGTQRLPRLIGANDAVAIITANRKLDAETAHSLGLVDAILTAPYEAEAFAFARSMIGRPLPSPASVREITLPDKAFWAQAEARLTRSARGNRAPLAALHAVRTGLEQGFTKGLAEERESFLSLRQSAEAAAMRHLFFAERAASRPAALRGIAPLPLRRIGVVGAGLMGTGIAAALRQGGLDVIITERDEAGRDRGAAMVRSLFEAEARRKADPKLVQQRMAGTRLAAGLDALADCDLVIEAVFEDLALKQAIFRDLQARCRPDAVLATNTSYLDPREIFGGLANPGRAIGLHFFSPAQIMKLLEIVPLPQTQANIRATSHELARRLGKTPVVSGICEGFIGNRILKRYRGEAERLVRAGLEPAVIDRAIREYGFAMGPFEMQDMAGLEIAHRRLEAARQSGENIPIGPVDLLVRAGRIGQKAGKGWYDYADGSRIPLPSAEIPTLLAPLIVPSAPLSTEDIAQTLVGAMAAEGEKILEEGIAASAGEIDLVEVLGYGFPRHRGGPMFAARQPSFPITIPEREASQQ